MEVRTKIVEEDDMAAKELQHVIIDPGHSRGRISLFHHLIKTYWLAKCLLFNAIS